MDKHWVAVHNSSVVYGPFERIREAREFARKHSRKYLDDLGPWKFMPFVGVSVQRNVQFRIGSEMI